MSQVEDSILAGPVAPAAGNLSAGPATGSRTDDNSTNEASGPLEQAADWKRMAVGVALEVVGMYPDDAISHALLGSAYFNIGQSEEAVASLRRCIELDPRQTEAYEILARISYEKGELEEAVRLCDQGMKYAGANLLLLNRKGQALLDLGRAGEAVPVFEQTLRLPDHTSESFYLLGQAYMQTEDYPKAIKSFEDTVKRTPEHTQAIFGLFTANIRLGQIEAAERYREQFLKLETEDRLALTDRSAQEDTLTGLPLVRETVARTLFGAGQIYTLHQRTGKAEELFFRASAIAPDNAMSRAALEASLARRGATREAVGMFEKLAAEQPGNSLNYFFLARLRERLQQFEATEQAYQKIQELAPENPEGYRGLIELYLRSDRKPAQAKALTERLLELEPDHGPNYYLLGFSSVKSGDLAGAVTAMEKAVRLSPGNQRFQDFLRQLKETQQDLSRNLSNN